MLLTEILLVLVQGFSGGGRGTLCSAVASQGFQALLTLLAKAAATVPSLVEETDQLLSLRAQPGSAGTS